MHEERPDRHAVIPHPAVVLLNELLEVADLEVPCLREPRAEKGLAHPAAQRAAEPACERHREAHLAPIEHFVGQMRLHRALEMRMHSL